MSDPSGAHAYHSMEMGPAGITSGASRLEGPHSFWEERELGSVVNLQLGSGYGGSTDRLDESGTEDHTQQLLALNDTHGTRKDDHKLGQLLATSISGNDITSSALYVVAVCAYYAGFWAPICLFLVSVVVLYLFRDIYAEVITALPVNGGTYTVLLNTSTKAVAGLAASLSLISYIATCVVSASVAVHYLGEVWSGINQSLGTCLLIIFFAVLSFCGVKDSARVACTIFIMHMCVMTILIIDCLDTAFRDNFNLLRENFNSRGEFANYPFAKAIFFGFSSAMLGISGFETSANYVEEQKPGVFPKTLRNMWLCVGVLNPTLAFLALCTIPLPQIMGTESEPNNTLLQDMAGQDWLKNLVSMDAFFVLAGAVLTAYVGFTGLAVRLSLDRCLPMALLARNRMFGTYHVVISSFCVLCISLYFITDRKTLILSSVYTIAFLSVMTLFGVGNLVLKYKRARIRRVIRAKVRNVLIAIGLVCIGVIGNLLINSQTLVFFLLYYGLTLLVVGLMFQRVRLLNVLLRWLVKSDVVRTPRELEILTGWRGWLAQRCAAAITSILDSPCVFLVKSRSVQVMNKAVAYVRDNELTDRLIFVHVHVPGCEPNLAQFQADAGMLQLIYPTMRIDMYFVEDARHFDGEVVQRIVQELGIPASRFFMSCPSETFPFDIAQLGGLRLITH
eukprot:m.193501 g.193501  ORF g.193501 m.193501 type:complete len:676 (-) comp21766_c0_seq6:54-2081(-)